MAVSHLIEIQNKLGHKSVLELHYSTRFQVYEIPQFWTDNLYPSLDSVFISLVQNHRFVILSSCEL